MKASKRTAAPILSEINTQVAEEVTGRVIK